MKARYICPDGHISCDIDLGFCPVCQKKMVLDSTADKNPQEKDWMDEIIDDNDLWYEPAFTVFPSFFINEYRQIKEFLENKKAHAALFKIKDIIETVLKFYILAVCAWAKQNHFKKFEKQLLPHITTPNLSLGSWLALGNQMVSYFQKRREEKVPDVLFDGLLKVISFYRTHNFINWRNEKIAHGALINDDSEDFQIDVKRKITEIKQLFDILSSSLSSMELTITQVSSVNETDANMESDNPVLLLTCLSNKISFILNPFMSVDNQDIFFFDNQKSEKHSQLQCYVSGKRKTRNIPYFSELSRLLQESPIDREESINSDYRSLAQDTALDSIGIDSDFVEPLYLTAWLQEAILQNPKGIIALGMERGMGKSIYTERINSLRKNPVVISNDVDVRTYHITRSQIMGKSDFERTIETQWITDYQGNIWIDSPRIRDFYAAQKKISTAFADYLNQCLRYSQKRRGKSKILMVIDGLDEINDQTIWDYFPDRDDLADGVYILLTYRTENAKSISSVISEQIALLSPDVTLLIDSKAEEYTSFLAEYINRMIPQSRLRSQLVNVSDGTMFSLSLICKLLKYGWEINAHIDIETIISYYWQEIRRQYGPSGYERIKTLISLFCVYGIDDSVSIMDIASILYGGEITYELLGELSDIMPFLLSERGFNIFGNTYQGDTRYRFVNEHVGEVFKSLIPDYLQIIAKTSLPFIDTIITKQNEPTPTIPFAESDLVLFGHYSVQTSQNKNRDLVGFLSRKKSYLAAVDEDGYVIQTTQYSCIIESYNPDNALFLLMTEIDKLITNDNAVNKNVSSSLEAIASFFANQAALTQMVQRHHIAKSCHKLINLIISQKLFCNNIQNLFKLTSIVSRYYADSEMHVQAKQVYIDFLEWINQRGLHNEYSVSGLNITVLMEIASLCLKFDKLAEAEKCLLSVRNIIGPKACTEIMINTTIQLARIALKTNKSQEAFMYIDELLGYLWGEQHNNFDKLLSGNPALVCYICIVVIEGMIEFGRNEKDLEVYECYEKNLDMCSNIMINLAENLYRKSIPTNYRLLVDVYKSCVTIYNRPRRVTKLDYSDWALAYCYQILYLLDKSRQRGEYIDMHEYLEMNAMALTLEKKLKMNNSNSTMLQFHQGQSSSNPKAVRFKPYRSNDNH